MERHEGGYYIRLMARTLTGTAATIAHRLAEQNIPSSRSSAPSGRLRRYARQWKSFTGAVILITYATAKTRCAGAAGGATRQVDQRRRR